MKISAKTKPRLQRLLSGVASLGTVSGVMRWGAGLGLLPEWFWSRMPANGVVDVILPGGRSRFKYASVPADAIGRYLHWRGGEGYEPETTRIFEELAKAANLTLDIGANTGLFTLIAASANQTGRVMAFEPVKSNLVRLRANIELNGLGARCEVYPIAVSDTSGVKKFHVPYAELPHSGSLDTSGFNGLAGEVTEVEVDTIDSICEHSGKVDLVKVDVEGYECQVFRGMINVIRRWHPILIFECIVPDELHFLQSLLEEQRYSIYHLVPDGPLPTQELAMVPGSKFRNVMCVPLDGTVSIPALPE